MQRKIDGLKVAIVATDGFEQSELVEPRRALEKAGAEVVIVAPKEGEIQGFEHFDKADTVKVDRTLADVEAMDFDAVMLPGGALNADQLRMEEGARKLLKACQEEGKPIAAICHAPWVLVSAGLVKGRELTSYHTIQDDVRNAGGRWKDAEVIRDGNWVTSRKPDDLPAFNAAMIELFAEARQSRHLDA